MTTPGSQEGSSEASSSKGQGSAEPEGTQSKHWQRPVTSCSFCYRRKIKCSKTFPCTQCVRRGRQDSCEQGNGGLDRTSKVPKKITPGAESEEILRKKIANLEKKLKDQDHILMSLQQRQTQQSCSSAATRTPTTNEDEESGSGSDSGSNSGSDTSDSIMELAAPRPPNPDPIPRNHPGAGIQDTLLEAAFRAWGMDEVDNKAIRSNPASYKSTDDLLRWSGLSLVDMVPLHCSTVLVQASAKFLGWMHCAVHWPTFFHEHENWILAVQEGRVTEPRYDWLALYFLIISASLFYLDNVVGPAAGLSPDKIETLPRFWFEASTEALRRSNYQASPTFETLQAICVMPMVAHNFGKSAYCESLLQTGLGIAQRFNLHRLGPDAVPTPHLGRVKLELGRRLWVCLMAGESLSPMAMKPHALFYSKAQTAPPSNVNDEALSDNFPFVPISIDQPTIVTQRLAIRRLATIFRAFNKAISRATTIDDQYKVSLEADKSIFGILSFCPALAWTGEASEIVVDLDLPFSYIPWARVELVGLVHASRITVYRALYARSFTDSRFGDIRRTCLEAARQFLMVRRASTNPLLNKSWYLWSDSVTAGMVLATELLHGEDTPEAKALLREEVFDAIALIQTGVKISAVAHRGVAFLQRMVDSLAPPASGSLDLNVLPEETKSDWAWPWPSVEVDQSGKLVWNSNGAYDSVMGDFQWYDLENDVAGLW